MITELEVTKVIDIIEDMFDGYCSEFDAKTLASNSNTFATEEFKYDRAKALSDKVIKRAEEEIKERTPHVEQIQDIVEDGQQLIAGRKDLRPALGLLGKVLRRPIGHFRKADDGIERRTDIMAHVEQKS